MAQFEIASHGVSAQVEIAVFHADVVAAVGIIFDGEGRRDALTENIEVCNDYFDVAGGQVGVLALSLLHLSLDLDAELASQFVGALAELCIYGFIEHQLCESVAVAQVDEGHTAHFSGALHPSGQGHLLAYVGDSQFSACVCSVHIINLWYFAAASWLQAQLFYI